MELVARVRATLRNIVIDFIERVNFGLPLQAWKNTQEIVYSIIFATLAINILALIFPLTLLQIYDRIIPNQSMTTLIWLAVAVIISLILGAFLKVVRTYVGAWADARFEHVVGCRAFDKILNCNLSEYEKEGSGRHLKRISALNMLKNFYVGQALVSIVDIPFIFIFLILIAYIGTWIVFVPIAVIFLVFYVTFSNTTLFQTLLEERQDHDDRRLNFIVETISKVHTIKSNTMEAQMLRRFERLQKYSSFYDYKMTQHSAHLMSDSVSLSQLTIVMVVAIGSTMVFNGALSVGGLAACTLLAGRCLQPVNMIISMWSRLQAIKVAHEEISKVLSMESELKDDLKKVENIKGKIVFDKIYFRHEEEQSFLLKDFNLTIMPNETISISGEGVSGKTTILWMILKLVKPQSGKIFIDDQDIQTLDPVSLRRFISYMPQQAVLFQGTLLENLTLFEEQYETRAKQLCEKVGLLSFIEHFPDGYDTKIGTQSAEALPRGIMQRVVIVRSLIYDPKIILFDEANTTVDMEGDKKIRELLQNLSKNHTIIIVSHRPSIVALAQKQYVIEDGKLRLTE